MFIYKQPCAGLFFFMLYILFDLYILFIDKKGYIYKFKKNILKKLKK